mmetsp:Transcript_65520/g.104238  ORF Transcript_65520/g.104238 Transcript_65520/m.104238 type:complete len:297 (-) Transcript_65520:1499-2389(-)
MRKEIHLKGCGHLFHFIFLPVLAAPEDLTIWTDHHPMSRSAQGRAGRHCILREGVLVHEKHSLQQVLCDGSVTKMLLTRGMLPDLQPSLQFLLGGISQRHGAIRMENLDPSRDELLDQGAAKDAARDLIVLWASREVGNDGTLSSVALALQSGEANGPIAEDLNHLPIGGIRQHGPQGWQGVPCLTCLQQSFGTLVVQTTGHTGTIGEGKPKGAQVCIWEHWRWSLQRTWVSILRRLVLCLGWRRHLRLPVPPSLIHRYAKRHIALHDTGHSPHLPWFSAFEAIPQAALHGGDQNQ